MGREAGCVVCSLKSLRGGRQDVSFALKSLGGRGVGCVFALKSLGGEGGRMCRLVYEITWGREAGCYLPWNHMGREAGYVVCSEITWGGRQDVSSGLSNHMGREAGCVIWSMKSHGRGRQDVLSGLWNHMGEGAGCVIWSMKSHGEGGGVSMVECVIVCCAKILQLRSFPTLQ